MEENSELEEGEAFHFKGGDYSNNNNVDPDIALSYIDEKIQNVLGHFQKDFEGGVSAENLGAKYGGYGSFLPAYERSPQRNSVLSHPKTPIRNSGTPKSPSNLPVKGACQSLKVPYAAPYVRLGTSSCSVNELPKARLPSGNVSFKHEFSSSSAPSCRKSKLKDENSNKSGNLKLRIKMGSDSMPRNNAAIYSGLGLDNSPSTSLGNSPEESCGILLTSKQTADESPTSILQVMTSFPIPGGALISPLHDNLFCLIKKERLSRDFRPAPLSQGSQTNVSLAMDESVSFISNERFSKGKEVKFPVKSERVVQVKHENDNSCESTIAYSARVKLENDDLESKGVLSNNMKSMPPADTANGERTLRIIGRPSEVPLEPDRDRVRHRLFSSGSVKADLFESRSGQDSGNREKINVWTQSGSMEMVPIHRAVTCDNDASVKLRDNKKSKSGKTRASSEGSFDAFQHKEDCLVGSLASSKQESSQQPAFYVRDGVFMSSKKERRQSEGKQLNVTGNSRKTASLSTNDNSGVDVSGAPKDLDGPTHGVSKSKDNKQKLKLQDSNKLRDNHQDHSDSKSEQENSQMCSLERPYGSRQKDVIVNDLEVLNNASFDNSRDKFRGKRVGSHSIPRSSVKDVANIGNSAAGNVLAPAVAPPASNPVLIEEHWVACDSCQKWRLLPYGTMPEQLPEKWLCSMLNWLPGMNRCDISEEETTRALHALYQGPPAVGQNNLQNHAIGTTSEVHAQHGDRSYPSLGSLPGPAQGKKKRGLKEIAKAGKNSGLIQSSDFSNKQLQESVKSRSENNMNHPPAEANLVGKSSFNSSSKSQYLVTDAEENPVDGGYTKQLKMKSKREADQYGYMTSKKTKTDADADADKHHDFNMDLGRVSQNSKSGLSIKANGKEMLKSNEGSFPGDVKCDAKEGLLVSVKELPCSYQISSDGRSLDVRTNDNRNISVKKRKMEWQDDQNFIQSSANVDESSESGLKKQKKSRVSKFSGSIMNSSNEKLGKNEVGHILSPGSQDGVLTERHMHKDKQPRKHKKQFTSQQNVEGTDILRKDIGPGQLSMTATSSSSKVSGSVKTRTTFEDVKGSPVESVSSSPLRTPFSEKLGSIAGNILGKDDARNGGLPVINKSRRDGKGDDLINQSGTTKKEEVSSGPHPEALKSFRLDYQDGDAKHQSSQTKCSSVLLNGGSGIKNLKENTMFLKKSGNGPSLRLKEHDRSSTSDFDRDKIKVSELVDGQGDILNKRIGYESEIDPRSFASLHKSMNNVKHNVTDKLSSKLRKVEKVNSSSSSIGQFSKDNRLEDPQKLRDYDDANAKLDAKNGRKRSAVPQEKLIQDSVNETKVDTMQKTLRNETPKLVQCADLEAKSEGHIHQSSRSSQQVGASDGHQVHASSNGDVSKASRHPGNKGTNVALSILDVRNVKGHNAAIPGRTNSSNQTAINALKEAKDLRDYADRLKISGFGFESNEISFQAALKFLRGGSLLESCNEAGRQGEMTQMQAYSTTAKLCECCAVEYERRHEMAAAALAYKCMEFAHWRVVYCKSSSLSRDRNELHACLQTFSQGESPSSSASDIDNLNNQATIDKATISKGTISHVAGNPVIVARNNSNFLWLLDFTQDVNFAMVASRKSQNAYSAANLALEEAQNRDCIISVKKVIDLSFQNVEELLRRVQKAMEAVTCAGWVDAKD